MMAVTEDAASVLEQFVHDGEFGPLLLQRALPIWYS
jgi:hypothetical protein